jgi:hypothetical protein
MGPGGLDPVAEVDRAAGQAFGQDETRENRSFRFPRRQGYDRRQHPFHPWRFKALPWKRCFAYRCKDVPRLKSAQS